MPQTVEIKNHAFEFKIESPSLAVSYDDPRIHEIMIAIGAVRKFMPVIEYIYKKESSTTAKFTMRLSDGRTWEQSLDFGGDNDFTPLMTFPPQSQWRESEFGNGEVQYAPHRELRRLSYSFRDTHEINKIEWKSLV